MEDSCLPPGWLLIQVSNTGDLYSSITFFQTNTHNFWSPRCHQHSSVDVFIPVTTSFPKFQMHAKFPVYKQEMSSWGDGPFTKQMWLAGVIAQGVQETPDTVTRPCEEEHANTMLSITLCTSHHMKCSYCSEQAVLDFGESFLISFP